MRSLYLLRAMLGGLYPPLTLRLRQGPSLEVPGWETGDPAPLHEQAFLFNLPILCLLGWL